GSVGITSVQLPEYQRLIIYYSGDKEAIEAILRQSLKNASEIQEIPIISFGNSVSIFDVPIDRLMHIRERTDRALQKSTSKEGAGTEPMK
ncbi:MAG: hypothetical protein NTY37_11350, partial [Methanothrix sp.]|nr:hypothetical protein [Methanothrix sp.]